jgi:hypothetical protein
LKEAGLNPWLDKECLITGKNWKISIKKAIKKSRYFIPLFSSVSVEKRGYVQREFKYAIEVFDEFPESQIYVIPCRIDDCEIPYDKLEDIEYVDLFPNWQEGMRRIIQSITSDTNYHGHETVKHEVTTTGVSVTYDVKPQPKPSPLFRGEKRIFVDREEYIRNLIKEYLLLVQEVPAKVN